LLAPALARLLYFTVTERVKDGDTVPVKEVGGRGGNRYLGAVLPTVPSLQEAYLAQHGVCDL